ISNISSLVYEPRGQQVIIAGGEGRVHYIDAEKHVVLQTLNDEGVRVAISPDGSLLAIAGMKDTIRLRSLATGELIREMKGHTGRISHLAFSRDGRRLASSSLDRTVRLWNVADGSCTGILRGHTDEVLCVGFNRDGARLASGGRDEVVRLWDTVTLQE